MASKYQLNLYLKRFIKVLDWHLFKPSWSTRYGCQKVIHKQGIRISIKVKIVLIKSYNFIRIVKRYHGLIWHAYSIIVTEIQGINKDMALQMAFKAINDITRLNGIVLTLLVYSALPWMVEYDALLPTIT
jgi:hypothetical protein